jgi:hypothetical protein
LSLRFDATVKHLVEGYSLDWVRRFGVPDAQQVEVIDADVSTVTAAADRVLRVMGPSPCLVHFELQSGRDPTLPLRLLKYNVLISERHRSPVLSVAILLRPSADLAELTGEVSLALPDGTNYLSFSHRVVRLWQEPLESVLLGGVGTVPLAPLTDITPDALPEAIRVMDGRFRTEVPEAATRSLWASTFVLMGLRYPEELIDQVLQGVVGMKESVTYQKIVAEGYAQGRIEEARRFFLRLATRRLGPPGAAALAAIHLMNDPDQFEQLAERLDSAAGWDDLFTPA